MAKRKELIEPTVDKLRKFGAEPLTRWLIAAAKDRGTVTYGHAKRRLEKECGFSTIFSAMMGHPAGAAMDAVLAVDGDAPLLNVLLVQQEDGMPGRGAGYYLDQHFNINGLAHKNARKQRRDEWRTCFERAAAEVYDYPNWDGLYKTVYGRAYRPDTQATQRKSGKDGSEKDGLPRGRGGEGKNHKALRLWVQKNPATLLPRLGRVRAETEVELLSGDRVDAVYYAVGKTVAIEVKSRDSNDLDLQRGIYQCVKYRAVLGVMDARQEAPVEAVLVTETPLPGDLSSLARRLGIRYIEVPPNRQI